MIVGKSHCRVLMNYFVDVMERTFLILRSESISSEQNYFIQLALYHQDMHNEAFAYMWQSLSYEWPLKERLGSVKSDNTDSDLGRL